MNVRKLSAVALCEMRSCSRLVRTWVFIATASLAATGSYVGTCLSHLFASTSEFTPSPRFILGESASLFVVIFSLGIIFLAFDVRARDVRDRISGIIDAKPVSNIELVVGRMGGILVLMCIPMLVFICLVFVHGALAGLAGWGFGAPIEIWSVLSFVVLDIVPQLAWWGGVVMLLAVIVRYRVLVVVLATGLVILSFWLSSMLSWGHMEVAGAIASQVILPSDVAPVFATGTILLQRVAMMFLAFGFLLVSAALLPRMIPRRALFGLVGVGTFTVGVLTLVGMFNHIPRESEQRTAWLQVHQMQEVASFPDVQRVTGNMEIYPGRRMVVNFSLTVLAPQENTTDIVTFTFNPGYRIQKITLDTREIDDYDFQDGLLTIPKSYFDTEPVTLGIEATGKPDHRFAYLDARVDLKGGKVFDVSSALARYLGNRSYEFQGNFVALMPGVSWYPTSGVAIGRDEPQKFPIDHFEIDLTVSVPKKWLIAGPGKSELDGETRGRVSYRFRPENPVIDVALITSKFKRAAMTVRDIEFEFLYSSKHHATIAAMEKLLPDLQSWITERLEEAEKHGLLYPYESLTLVEVPSHLRAIGGGWSMESTLYAPGVVMIRELGIPTARFDVSFKRHEKGEQSLQQLVSYVDRDVQGVNMLIGIARNFVRFQTSPAGRGAIPMNYFIEDLIGELIVERLPYYRLGAATNPFSQVRELFGSSATLKVTVEDTDLATRLTQSRAMTQRSQNVHQMKNWVKLEETSISDLDFQNEPNLSYNVVLLRNTYAIAALKALMSEEALGQILASLVRQYRGSNFSYEGFRNMVLEIEPQFEDITQNWILADRLPGFIVSKPSFEQLGDEDDTDNPVFQTVFKIRNMEPVMGVATVYWHELKPLSNDDKDTIVRKLPPILIDPNTSYQIAINSSNRIRSISVEAPISLNRTPIDRLVPLPDEIPKSSAEPLPAITPIEWNPVPAYQVVVDDLDAGFSVKGEPIELDMNPIGRFFWNWQSSLFLAGDAPTADRGIPIYGGMGFVQQWARVQNEGYGKYRNTFTMVEGASFQPLNESSFTAEFATELPRLGEWALEFSVPARIWKGRTQSEVEKAKNMQSEGKPQSFDRWTISLEVQVNDDAIPIELNPLLLDFDDDAVAEEDAPDEDDEGLQRLREILQDEEFEELLQDEDIDFENLAWQSYIGSNSNRSRYRDQVHWAALGTYDISNSHAVVTVSFSNSVRYKFADAVRWTYLGNDRSE